MQQAKEIGQDEVPASGRTANAEILAPSSSAAAVTTAASAEASAVVAELLAERAALLAERQELEKSLEVHPI